MSDQQDSGAGVWKPIGGVLRPARSARPDELVILDRVVSVAQQWADEKRPLRDVMALTTASERMIATKWAIAAELSLLIRLTNAIVEEYDRTSNEVYINGIRLTEAMIDELGVIIDRDDDGRPIKVTFPIRYIDGKPIYPVLEATELGEMRRVPRADHQQGSALPDYLR